MPGTIRKLPLHTRTGRAQALLRLSHPVLQRLTETPPLRDVLHPFRSKASDAFSATAFIHSFGCNGPTDRQWRNLFACAGALRPEDLSVVIAYITCSNDMEEVVLGSPGILDHVCRLWDEWLVDEVLRLTGEAVEAEAAQWEVRKSPDGLVWGTPDSWDSPTLDCSLGESVERVACTIMNDVLRSIVHQALERASLGGQDGFLQLLNGKGTALVGIALGRAKAVLAEKVFGTARQRSCYAP